MSGRFLVLLSDGSFHDYDATTDTWVRQEASHPLAPRGGFEGFETPVGTYGVNLLVVWNFDDSSVWLYKHRPSEPPPPWDAGVADEDGGGVSGTDGGGVPRRDGSSAMDDGGAGATETPDSCGCRAPGRGARRTGWRAVGGAALAAGAAWLVWRVRRRRTG